MALIGGGFTNYVSKLFNDPELSDVTILLDNDEEENDASGETKSFYGHRVILATMSDYFRSMLYGSFVEATKKEIRLPGVPYSTFIKIMKVVYLGSTTPGTLEEAVEFYSLVRMLLMDSKLKAYFESWMIDQMETKDSWKKDLLKIFALAFEWDFARLVLKCNKHFSEIANEYVSNSAFVDLPLGAVQMILDTSNICCTRAELKRAIQSWISRHKGEITAEVADELTRKVAKFGKLCYDFTELVLCQKKNQSKPEKVQPVGECSTRMDVLEGPHDYSYVSRMTILECTRLKGVKICLKANTQFGPQNGRIKSELEMCFKMNYSGNSYRRNITVRYDFTQKEQQSVTIFFPEMNCCRDVQVRFHFSWTGSGVQPLLVNYVPARYNHKITAVSTHVTHIIFDDPYYYSDGRCPECPTPEDSDCCSTSSYYDSNDEMEIEQSENGSGSDED
uniref:BTB domain-containing protein n=1 Tax=Culex tarsalis TaxID=7177 RepID=A0A1Q3EY82_CULTA